MIEFPWIQNITGWTNNARLCNLTTVNGVRIEKQIMILTSHMYHLQQHLDSINWPSDETT
jgi:ribosomal protein S15P/S13E